MPSSILANVSPTTTDGKQIVLNNLFPGDVLTNYAGRSDDIDNNVRFGGDIFQLSRDSEGSVSREWQFTEWVYLAGGRCYYENAVYGDTIGFQILAPATAGTSNPGAGAYNKVEVATGLNLYVPAPSVDGGWDLNLSEKLNENVNFTKVVPVPSVTETGFFEWDPDTEAVALVPEQTGRFNLFDQQITIANFVVNAPMMGNRDLQLVVPAVKPKRILSHWKSKVTANHSAGSHVLNLAWYIYLARKSIGD